MTKLILNGSIMNGKKKYQNPDIIKSIVDNKTCYTNRLSINKKGGNYFIYHSYDKYNDNGNKIYSGRWYSTINDIILKKNILEIVLKNIEWENMSSGKIVFKDVKIKIFFTENGLKKINKYVNKN